jgi:hypothetical protein
MKALTVGVVHFMVLEVLISLVLPVIVLVTYHYTLSTYSVSSITDAKIFRAVALLLF